jgi:hypothetical protein
MDGPGTVIDAAELGLTGLAYTAGARVAPGRYRRIDAPARDIDLSDVGTLPASFDGRVAVYIPVAPFAIKAAN